MTAKSLPLQRRYFFLPSFPQQLRATERHHLAKKRQCCIAPSPVNYASKNPDLIASTPRVACRLFAMQTISTVNLEHQGRIISLATHGTVSTALEEQLYDACFDDSKKSRERENSPKPAPNSRRSNRCVSALITQSRGTAQKAARPLIANVGLIVPFSVTACERLANRADDQVDSPVLRCAYHAAPYPLPEERLPERRRKKAGSRRPFLESMRLQRGRSCRRWYRSRRSSLGLLAIGGIRRRLQWSRTEPEVGTPSSICVSAATAILSGRFAEQMMRPESRCRRRLTERRSWLTLRAVWMPIWRSEH